MSAKSKPKKTAKSTAAESELRAANDHQLQIYLSRYDRFWRLHKLFSLRFLLTNREALRAVVQEIYAGEKVDDEQLVYNNVTNGILADATSELVMLCEDYFSLLRFLREPLRFVKKAIAYSAGSVTTLSKSLREPNAGALRKLFFLPSADVCGSFFANHDLSTAHTNALTLDAQVQSLKSLHHDAIAFYDKHSDFHVQYKHGLKLALHGLHGVLPEAEIGRRKQELSAPLFAFENKPVSQLGYGSSMFLPNIKFEPLTKHLGALHEDLNLLHIQFLDNVDIDQCIGLGKKIVQLLNVLIENRLSLVTNNGTRRLRFILPVESALMQCQVYEFDAPLGHSVPALADFQLD
ncbi:hypothetical protein M3A49_24335 [Paraburkholderia sp. CNPSo 3076]|uniref:hypothetical protein n=1 Tax=Paraburkholderia sp. CNPSo 3076 TaxID=2940936 RepID=UPI0022553CB3|nr:hypothetical protein [Paraburkholderia sp. CNPSo 3076]MCX5542589.1 hypothetical protein [Paraburkholderia sp. CNPSo 3076]